MNTCIYTYLLPLLISKIESIMASYYEVYSNYLNITMKYTECFHIPLLDYGLILLTPGPEELLCMEGILRNNRLNKTANETQNSSFSHYCHLST
jgi:hypothetical protein